jgi:hypothetical protein
MGPLGVRKPGTGDVRGQASCGCIVACGMPHCPSGALGSDATEVRDELTEYYASERICCGYVGLDELSSPVDVENWDCACDVSDGVIGP